VPDTLSFRALTLDLDDTLWPVWPAIVRAEERMHRWLLEHAPRCAERFPVLEMRALRASVAQRHPHLAHDYSSQRRITLREALRDSGEDQAHADSAYEIFLAGRNDVELYPDVPEALARLAARFPIAALTNGSADLGRIGLREHFVFELGACEHGAPKPDASIFLAACERLDLPPQQVLHIGDDPELDVLGARRAGLGSAWINREARIWEHAEQPDISVTTLSELADLLEHDAMPASATGRQ
jgi:putative hydrolase of the HAD superfamily